MKLGKILLLVLVLTMSLSAVVYADDRNRWVHSESGSYYYENGIRARGWKTIAGKRYFFLKSGKTAIGRYYINGVFYYFNSEGVYVKTMPRARWVNTKKGRRFDNGDGNYSKGKWQNIQGKRYRFSKAGYVLTGKQTIKNATYYFESKGAMVRSEWVQINGGLYFFGVDGKMVTNQWIDERYVGTNGKVISDYVDETRGDEIKTGWVGFGSRWKYYSRGRMVTGWKNISGKRYYFQSSGFMKIGWYNDGSNYYFFNTTAGRETLGVMATEFMRIDGKVYYFFPTKVKDSNGVVHPKGSMARDLKIRRNNGKEYTFDKQGVCQELK